MFCLRYHKAVFSLKLQAFIFLVLLHSCKITKQKLVLTMEIGVNGEEKEEEEPQHREQKEKEALYSPKWWLYPEVCQCAGTREAQAVTTP